MTKKHTRDRSRLAAEFARIARETAAVGEQVQVWIDGITADPAEVCGLRIFDEAGVPHIACRDNHAIIGGVGHRARIVITRRAEVPGPDDPGVTVVLEGQLHLIGRGIPPLAAGMVAMGVDLDSIIVEQQPSTGPLQTIQVSVDSYLSVDINPLAIHRTAITTHFNAAHGSELRHCVARLASTALSDIAAAMITELTDETVTLSWIDYDGTHGVTLSFSRRATAAAELDLLLPECLTHSA